MNAIDVLKASASVSVHWRFFLCDFRLKWSVSRRVSFEVALIRARCASECILRVVDALACAASLYLEGFVFWLERSGRGYET